MTMKLTIKNDDATRVGKATVEDFQMGKAEPSVVDAFEIEPGASREVWVHASRRVVLTESALAQRPVKP